MNSPNKILVFAAHQDDETIGCGGTIRKWSSSGSIVDVVFMTDGGTGVDQSGRFDSDIVSTRKKEAEQAAEILGVSKIHNLNLECQNIKNSKKNFHKVISLIRELKPDLVITHHTKDKHRDHRKTAKIVLEACWKSSENIHKELGKPHKVGDVWTYEITDPLPKVDFIVDISETYSKKIEAMKIYNSQENVIDGIFNFLDGISKVRGYLISKERGEGFMRASYIPMEI
jgi:LmbE family N-acetylglucosaminyl deacetylase